jgi:hypothetical protein
MARSIAVAGIAVLLSCASSAEPRGPGGDHPGVDELPDRPELPDLLVFRDGRRVASAEDFRSARAGELRELLAHYVYGRSPAPPPLLGVEEVARADDVLDATASYREVAIRFQPSGAPALHLAIVTPKGVPRPPVFLGPNKCGNHTVLADPRVRRSTTFVLRACETAENAEAWPLPDIIGRGFAVATFHESDVCPDDADHVGEGLAAHHPVDGDPATRWGTIAQWAWGISRAMDALVNDPSVDGTRIALVGHSRRGKAALWAAANDPRPALVVAHQSGTAGAALFRSPVGETIAAINTLFPHWFDETFVSFAGNETRLPFDQHALLALIAPRPLLVTDGDADTWADPPGARAAVEAAAPVWTLLGSEGLVGDGRGGFSEAGALVWRARPGAHFIGREDWNGFLDYAAVRLR